MSISGTRGNWWGRWLAHLSIIAFLPLAGCLRIQTAEPAIGEAFVAPASLEVREEITPRAKLAATLKHGDRVEILARRRRFARVRVPSSGATGWTDGRQLLSDASMGILRAESERGAKAPAQGTARTVDALNVHITPHRGSPSFHRLAEGDLVTIVQRAVLPRMQYVPPGEESGQLVIEPAPRDDWSFIRLADKKRCGWVLTGMLMPELPLDILQLADGSRITSFFTLGQAASKPVYFWTSSKALPERVQFDSFRVLAYNAAKERYETTYVERDVEGYLPVSIETGDGGEGRHAVVIQLIYASTEGEGVERHTFEYRDKKLKRLARGPWQRPNLARQRYAEPLPDAPSSAEEPDGLLARAVEWLKGSWRRR